eukprot:TRINITY_DN4614_c0_g3_i1.p1 TRINITY_DN4614_c0_g3~~TRINITY_DN4614_c0_g3_i1.p1  ORF type:complete len:762 (+),score=193.80 TRINITY_DN4614_c0_g3_i1:123-2408(+)
MVQIPLHEVLSRLETLIVESPHKIGIFGTRSGKLRNLGELKNFLNELKLRSYEDKSISNEAMMTNLYNFTLKINAYKFYNRYEWVESDMEAFERIILALFSRNDRRIAYTLLALIGSAPLPIAEQILERQEYIREQARIFVENEVVEAKILTKSVSFCNVLLALGFHIRDDIGLINAIVKARPQDFGKAFGKQFSECQFRTKEWIDAMYNTLDDEKARVLVMNSLILNEVNITLFPEFIMKFHIPILETLLIDPDEDYFMEYINSLDTGRELFIEKFFELRPVDDPFMLRMGYLLNYSPIIQKLGDEIPARVPCLNERVGLVFEEDNYYNRKKEIEAEVMEGTEEISMPPSINRVHVSTIEELEALGELVAKSDVAAYDGEWVPQRSKFLEQKGCTRMAVLQVSVPGSVFLVDTLLLRRALKDMKDNGSDDEYIALCARFQEAFFNMFTKKGPLRIGYQFQIHDIATLRNAFDDIPTFKQDDFFTDLVDLHKSGCGSLNNTVQDAFGKVLSKKSTLVNWEVRPLSESQMLYATMDAWCLMPLFGFVAKLNSIEFMENAAGIDKSLFENALRICDDILVRERERMGFTPSDCGALKQMRQQIKDLLRKPEKGSGKKKNGNNRKQRQNSKGHKNPRTNKRIRAEKAFKESSDLDLLPAALKAIMDPKSQPLKKSKPMEVSTKHRELDEFETVKDLSKNQLRKTLQAHRNLGDDGFEGLSKTQLRKQRNRMKKAWKQEKRAEKTKDTIEANARNTNNQNKEHMN